MRIAQSRTCELPRAHRTTVVTNAILLARRIHELQRRRQALVARQEQLRAQLPDWAIEPLRLVGMTSDEIRSMVDDMSEAEAESGLAEVERQLDQVDEQIDEMERLLVATPSNSLEEIEAVVHLTATRFHEIMATDPNDVFYDHGEARLVALIERVRGDLSDLIRRTRSDAS
jgi:DNA-binding transcriptional MerR regulator